MWHSVILPLQMAEGTVCLRTERGQMTNVRIRDKRILESSIRTFLQARDGIIESLSGDVWTMLEFEDGCTVDEFPPGAELTVRAQGGIMVASHVCVVVRTLLHITEADSLQYAALCLYVVYTKDPLPFTACSAAATTRHVRTWPVLVPLLSTGPPCCPGILAPVRRAAVYAVSCSTLCLYSPPAPLTSSTPAKSC
jgi:hypothetical protein